VPRGQSDRSLLPYSRIFRPNVFIPLITIINMDFVGISVLDTQLAIMRALINK
jgi:hypothetical protein